MLQTDPSPLVNLIELWRWEQKDIQVPPIDELRHAQPKKKYTSQLMIIHDSTAPVCDRWEGCPVSGENLPFLYTHWWHIETFCYYGHALVTIPPPSITSLAHKHGVRVIGTILFEGEQGKSNLKFLGSEKTIKNTVGKLVLIMQKWKFDGWLVDVEVDLSDHLAGMGNFVNALTLRTRAATEGKGIIWWYDGVEGHNGRKQSMNVFDEKSTRFYKISDGIVTNHRFRPSRMTTVGGREMKGRSGTVCIGIDVRGTKTPDGWKTHEHVKEAMERKCSAALYAPSWAVEAEENMETDEEENIEANEEENIEADGEENIEADEEENIETDEEENIETDEEENIETDEEEENIEADEEENIEADPLTIIFWTKLSPVLNTRPVHLPIKTSFRNGFDGKFFRRRNMDLMPHLSRSNGVLIPTEEGLLIKEKGRHLLWAVENMESHSNLRIKIRRQGKGILAIELDLRRMKVDRMIAGEGIFELRPMNGESLKVKTINVVTTEPDIILTYFETCFVELERCIDRPLKPSKRALWNWNDASKDP